MLILDLDLWNISLRLIGFKVCFFYFGLFAVLTRKEDLNNFLFFFQWIHTKAFFQISRRLQVI